MGYRLIADEHVEPLTRRFLRERGHDIEWVGHVPELGLGAVDADIAAYSRDEDRLLLTRDDDFLTRLDPSDTAGVLFLRDRTLSESEIAEIVDTIEGYLPQEEVTLEYLSRNWLERA